MFNLVLINVMLPIAISLLTTIIYNIFYKPLNKNRIKEELKINGSPQIATYNINTSKDLENLIKQAFSCENYIIEFEVEDKEEDKCKRHKVNFKHTEVDIESLDCTNKWKYIYIKNNSQIDVLLSRIIDKQNFPVNMYEWSRHLIERNGCLGILINRYNQPNKIILDFNGWNLEYSITDRAGNAVLNLKESTMKK